MKAEEGKVREVGEKAKEEMAWAEKEMEKGGQAREEVGRAVKEREKAEGERVKEMAEEEMGKAKEA